MLADLRHALRSLARTPGFTVVAVLTLALGIGANATVFSWMEGLVLNPFPGVPAAERLVTVRRQTPSGDGPASYPEFADWRGAAPSVDGLVAYQFYRFGVQEAAGAGPAEPVWGAFASSDYFRTLGVRPVLGRFFAAGDTVPGARVVVVLSHGLWRQRFAADPAVLGRRLRVNGREAVVVGVAPPSFSGSFAALAFDLWVPLTAYDQLGDYQGKLAARGSHWLTLFGRLRPGATVARARAELATASARLAAVHPEERDVTAAVHPFDGGMARGMLRPLFAALLGVTAVILLIVCANVANLLLARGAARHRELGVRAALGAGRARLARQLLVEAAALAAPGAVLGVAGAAWGRELLGALVPATGLPLAFDTPLNLTVLAFVVAVTGAATLLFGVAPALRASRPDLVPALKSGTAGAGQTRSRLRGTFVVAQVALSLVALVAAGLFARTLGALEQIDPGFRDPARVLLVSTDFAFAGVRDERRQRETVGRLLERVRAIPGVTSAAAADFVPMGLSTADGWSVAVPGHVPRRGERTTFGVNRVSADYFATMRIPIVRGRAIAAADRDTSAYAIVVNEAFARHFFGGRDPIGERVGMGGGRPNATVVGVARDGVYNFDELSTMAGGAPPFVYLHYRQAPGNSVTLHLRTAGDPLALVPAVRRAMAAVDPALPVLSPHTLDDHARGAFFLQRTGAAVLAALGGVALLLAALGLYGVTAYAVAQRTREIGVRTALGAAGRQVTAAFLRDGLRLAGAGLALGTIGALGAGRLLAGQLHGVRAGDPLTLGATALLLAAVALAASYVPARRAARVDPMTALRSE